MAAYKKRRFSAVEVNSNEYFVENASYYVRWSIEKWWSCCNDDEIKEALRNARQACCQKNVENHKQALLHLLKISVEKWDDKLDFNIVADEPKLYVWALEIMHGPGLLFAAGDRNKIYGSLAIENTLDLENITQKYFETRDLLTELSKKEKYKAIEQFI